MNRRMYLILFVFFLGVAACSDDPAAPAPGDPDAGAPDAGDGGSEPDAGASDVGEPDASPEPDAPETPPDRDGDGVSDADELAAGTDPDAQDTDSDGFWDGWELAAGTDPNDPNSRPVAALPAGSPYLLAFTDLIEPSLLRPLLRSRLGSLPPILVFVEGLGEGVDDAVSLRGGIGEFVNKGVDEVPGTPDDVYGMRPSSISQLNGQYLIQFDGRVQRDALSASADHITIDLTGISEITEGVRLQVEQVQIDALLRAMQVELADGDLRGVFTRAGVVVLAEQFSDIIPVDPDLIVEQLDSDGDGTIPVHFTFAGRKVTVEGFAEPQREVEPLPRPGGACCPEGARSGDSIDPILAARGGEQGIQLDEEAMAEVAIDALIGDPEVQFVTTARLIDGQQHYFAYGAEGMIAFVRQRGPEGTTYPVVQQEGRNPLANTDPDTWGTLEALTGLGGANPEGTIYPQQGYTANDPRLHFLSRDEMTFPFAFERIAAYYDDPRASDLTVTEVSYTGGGFSSHGQLGALQSRSPLIMAGPGVRSALDPPTEVDFVVAQFPGDRVDPEARAMLMIQRTARGVDIAPTLAAALGVAPHALAVRDGRFTDDALLSWQDGRVLREVFTDEALERIDRGEPVAEYALIVINDGLTALEINHEAVNLGFDVAPYRRLFGQGLAFQFGAITNWPSNTFPSHNMIGCGAYSGHHGVLDNTFYERGVARSFSPITDLFETERFFGSVHPDLPVETLFEAVHRTFGPWDGTPSGVFTASFNDPSSRGATLSTLERRKPEVLTSPVPGASIAVGGRTFELPEASPEDFEAVIDNATLFNVKVAYLSGEVPAPRFAIVNFSSTDGAGHAFGPHGDFEREVVIPATGRRLEIVLAILEEAGILDRTLILLTSDHGMELRDLARQGSDGDRLAATGLRYATAGKGIFFKRLAVDVEGAEALAGGQAGDLRLRVLDRYTLGGPEVLAIEGAIIRVVEGAEAVEAVTDDLGEVILRVSPLEGAGEVILSIEHDAYNPERIGLSL